MPIPRREYDRTINSEIERLLYQLKVIRQEAEGLLWGLSDEQLNWQPASGRWSIAQCIDHLNVTNKLFITEMEKAIRDGRAAGMLSDGPFTYGFFARWLLRSLQPPVKRRMKAPKHMGPAPRKTMQDLTAEWERTHDQFADLLKDANGLDLARIKVTSPALRLLKYGLGMGFWIWTAHDRRHLWQAREVRNAAGFPA